MTSWILNCELPPPLLMDMKLIRRGRPPASSTLLEPTLKQMFEETPKHFIAMLTGLEEAYQARLSRMIVLGEHLAPPQARGGQAAKSQLMI